MLEHIRDYVKPDIVIWTGDTMPHDIGANTEEEVIEKVRIASEML
jgi:hypothetical protein